jgi:hypothetical protein
MKPPVCTRHAMYFVWLFTAGCEDHSIDDDKDGPPTCIDPDISPAKAPDIPITYTTERFEIHVGDGHFLCAGTAQDLDQFAGYVADQIRILSDRRIPLYLVDSTSEWCPPQSVGCSRRDGSAVVWSPSALHHEIVHSVACETRFAGPATLTEGLAVSFEPFPNSAQGMPSEFADLPRGPGFSYDEAGHFVRWLFEALGAESFMDLYATAGYDSGVWAAIEAAYGVLVEADYLATSPATWIPHRRCDDVPLLEPDGGVWTFDLHFDCSDPGTRGPYVKSTSWHWNSMDQSYLIDIPAPGTYRLERPDYLVEGDTGVFLDPCLDDHPLEGDVGDKGHPRVVFFTLTGHFALYEFPYAGLWRVDVLREHGPPVDTWVTIQPE